MMMYTKDMEVQVERVNKESSRDTYWTRIHLNSDKKETSVLVCASQEYLWYQQGIRRFTPEYLAMFMKSIGDKWRNKGDGVFVKPVHYDVYAVTKEGMQNGEQFLKMEVVT
jgi:hypothetical protein